MIGQDQNQMISIMGDILDTKTFQMMRGFLTGVLITSLSFSIKIWILDQIGPIKVLTFIIMLITGLALSFRYGYMEKVEWYTKKRDKIQGSLKIFDQVMKPPTVGSSRFSINDTRQSASLVYVREGKEYILNIPYSRTLLAKMTQCDATLYREVKGEEMEIDITQQPGVLYLCTASQLGGSRIVLKNRITGESKTFIDSIPTIEGI